MKKRWLAVIVCLCLVGLVLFGLAAAAGEPKAEATEKVTVTFHIGQQYEDLVVQADAGQTVGAIFDSYWENYESFRDDDGLETELWGFTRAGSFTSNASLYQEIDAVFSLAVTDDIDLWGVWFTTIPYVTIDVPLPEVGSKTELTGGYSDEPCYQWDTQTNRPQVTVSTPHVKLLGLPVPDPDNSSETVWTETAHWVMYTEYGHCPTAGDFYGWTLDWNDMSWCYDVLEADPGTFEMGKDYRFVFVLEADLYYCFEYETAVLRGSSNGSAEIRTPLYVRNLNTGNFDGSTIVADLLMSLEEMVNLTVDFGGKGTNVTVQVPKGANLSNAAYSAVPEPPVSDDGEWTGYALVTKEPSNYKSWEDIEDDWDLMSQTSIEEDTTVYVFWVKTITEVDLTIESPLCGTETTTPVKEEQDVRSVSYDWDSQTNPPQVTVNTEGVLLDESTEEGNEYLPAYWVDDEEGTNPYIGKFVGEQEYYVEVWLKTGFPFSFPYVPSNNPPIPADPGIVAKSFRGGQLLPMAEAGGGTQAETAPPVTVTFEGGEVVSVRVTPLGDLEVIVKVMAEHIEGVTTETVDPEPWCEDPGHKTAVTVCAACTKPYKTVETDLEPLDHIWPEEADKWVVTKNSTLTEDGEMKLTCERDSSHFQTKAFSYSFTEGDGSKWVKGTEDGLAFTVERSENDEWSFDRFTGIEIDGTAVAAENFTAAFGSVKITLTAAYLENLGEGDHEIHALFTDGIAGASFSVAATGPDAGEDAAILLFGLIGLTAAACLALVFGMKKKADY